MNFEEFKDKIADDVKETIEDRTGKSVTVEPRTVEKMNETYEGLTVKPDDGEIGVNLNLDSLYQEYSSGTCFYCFGCFLYYFRSWLKTLLNYCSAISVHISQNWWNMHFPDADMVIYS